MKPNILIVVALFSVLLISSCAKKQQDTLKVTDSTQVKTSTSGNQVNTASAKILGPLCCVSNLVPPALPSDPYTFDVGNCVAHIVCTPYGESTYQYYIHIVGLPSPPGVSIDNAIPFSGWTYDCPGPAHYSVTVLVKGLEDASPHSLMHTANDSGAVDMFGCPTITLNYYDPCPPISPCPGNGIIMHTVSDSTARVVYPNFMNMKKSAGMKMPSEKKINAKPLKK
jgi:hypothetical protein